MCTWNQRIIFFDLTSMDQMNLWIKLINLEVHQEILGEIHIDKLNSTNRSEWYQLTGEFSRSFDKSFSRIIQFRSITQSECFINNRHVRKDKFIIECSFTFFLS